MSDNETHQALLIEDRLKAIAYQFITLYERWSEDRQLAVKQGADTAELVKLFTEQLKSFKELEPKVRQQLATSIQNASTGVVEKIGEELAQKAVGATELITRQLAKVTEKTERTLAQYEHGIMTSQWKVIGISVSTTIVTCLLLVWLLIPNPTLPLSNEQINYLNSGSMMELVWPKLSKKEQQHWSELANQVQHANP